jgi:hypothetical protein
MDNDHERNTQKIDDELKKINSDMTFYMMSILKQVKEINQKIDNIQSSTTKTKPNRYTFSLFSFRPKKEKTQGKSQRSEKLANNNDEKSITLSNHEDTSVKKITVKRIFGNPLLPFAGIFIMAIIGFIIAQASMTKERSNDNFQPRPTSPLELDRRQ